MENTSKAVISGVNIDIIATLVATLLSTIVSSIVAFVTANTSTKHQERQNLKDLIIKIIEISLEYPYLEDDDYCSQWGLIDSKDEKSMRYDNYCCAVFNLIERLWKHCNRKPKKINDILYVTELVIRHQRWWMSETNNFHAYDKQFQEYIRSLQR
jgi:hypothetical protein